MPVQVRGALAGHEVKTAGGRGWKGRENAELLAAAEQIGFDVIVIADQNLRHQQNLSGRRIGVVERWTNHRPTLELHFPLIASAVAAALPGACVVVGPPSPQRVRHSGGNAPAARSAGSAPDPLSGHFHPRSASERRRLLGGRRW